MAWDFSTEPEFEEKLEWMRGFVRDEIIPLETLELDRPALDRLTVRFTTPLPDGDYRPGDEHRPPVQSGPASQASYRTNVVLHERRYDERSPKPRLSTIDAGQAPKST